MSSSLWPVMILGAIVSLGTYIVGFFFALTYRSNSRRASNFVLAGLGVLFIGWIAGYLGPAVLAQTLPPANLAFVMMSVNLLSSITFACGIALLITAAFVDRQHPLAPPSDVYLPGDQQPATNESNPYVATESK
jgi:hypothetical protein